LRDCRFRRVDRPAGGDSQDGVARPARACSVRQSATTADRSGFRRRSARRGQPPGVTEQVRWPLTTRTTRGNSTPSPQLPDHMSRKLTW